MDIAAFRGELDFLSNFYDAPVEYDGILYLNNEAAFQAQKCSTKEERYAFAYLSAVKAKRKGRQVKLRDDWDRVKVGLMEEIVWAKFRQNPHLAKRLLATGDAILAERNDWHDAFWGIDSTTGKGENHLGIILMKIREKLKSDGK